MSANDEKRCAFVRAYLNGNGGIRWRGITPTATEDSDLAYSLRRSCTFDDDTHRTGSVEFCGKRVNFEVLDSALVVTLTDETLDPRHVTRWRPVVELEQQRRAAERAVNTVQHRKRFGR